MDAEQQRRPGPRPLDPDRGERPMTLAPGEVCDDVPMRGQPRHPVFHHYGLGELSVSADRGNAKRPL
jgi:hypothetical protein